MVMDGADEKIKSFAVSYVQKSIYIRDLATPVESLSFIMLNKW